MENINDSAVFEEALRNYSVNGQTEQLADLLFAWDIKEDTQDKYKNLLCMKLLVDKHPEFYNTLGDLFWYGICFENNDNKALELYQKATENGINHGYYNQAFLYYRNSEYRRALELFEKCIKIHDFPENVLANCYACAGDSCMKISNPDERKAIEYLLIAADKYHDAYSCRRLYSIYADKNSPQFDAIKAIRFAEAGVEYGDSNCAVYLARCYIHGDVQLNIKENRNKAQQLLLKFPEDESFDRLYSLGDMFMFSDEENGFKADVDLACKYLEQAWNISRVPILAARLGYIYYLSHRYWDSEEKYLYAEKHQCYPWIDFLGRMYKDGDLGTPDLKKAEKYYEYAYKNNDFSNLFTCCEYVELLEKLGKYNKVYEVSEYGEEKYNDIYFLYYKAKMVVENGIVVQMTENEAIDALKVVAGFVTMKGKACSVLGTYYLKRFNYRLAEVNLLDAYNEGEVESAVWLARIYETGGGSVLANPRKAAEWYLKSGINKYIEEQYATLKYNLYDETLSTTAQNGVVSALELFGQYPEYAAQVNLALGQFKLKKKQILEAERLLMKAYEAGEIEAAVYMGYLEESRNNIDIAYSWFKKAAEAGSICGQQELGCFEQVRKGIFSSVMVMKRVRSIK